MKTRRFILLALCAVSFACSKHDNGQGSNFSDDDFKGTAQLTSVLENSANVTTKADEDWSDLEIVDGKIILPSSMLPNPNDCSLEINGKYVIPDPELGIQPDGGATADYHLTGITLADYALDIPYLYAGDYTATITYGDPTEEGYSKPYLYKQHKFTIVARKSTQENISVGVQNAIVREIQTTESFNKYYSSAEFTVSTSAGAEVSLVVGEKTLFFVEEGTTLTLKGKATKVSGSEVTFSGNIGTAEARNCYTIEVDAGSIGGGSIKVSFNGDISNFPVVNSDVELNPEV